MSRYAPRKQTIRKTRARNARDPTLFRRWRPRQRRISRELAEENLKEIVDISPLAFDFLLGPLRARATYYPREDKLSENKLTRVEIMRRHFDDGEILERTRYSQGREKKIEIYMYRERVRDRAYSSEIRTRISRGSHIAGYSGRAVPFDRLNAVFYIRLIPSGFTRERSASGGGGGRQS